MRWALLLEDNVWIGIDSTLIDHVGYVQHVCILENALQDAVFPTTKQLSSLLGNPMGSLQEFHTWLSSKCDLNELHWSSMSVSGHLVVCHNPTFILLTTNKIPAVSLTYDNMMLRLTITSDRHVNAP